MLAAVVLPLLLATSCRSDLLIQNRTDRRLTVTVESRTNRGRRA